MSRFFNTLILVVFMVFFCVQTGVGQEIIKEITMYEEAVKQKPGSADAHINLGKAYIREGMADKAIDEFEIAMKIRYEEGKNEALRTEKVKIYGRYVILSIITGLFILTVVVYITAWGEINEKISSMRKDFRVKAFAKNINTKLAQDLRERALEIAEKKEKLRDAINRENDPGLREIASGIFPRLDDLTRQAALLLELQNNLSGYINDIDPAKLEMAHHDCEEKLRMETDQEARRAIEYQLKQIKNKQDNYAKARAKIRTCDAVLNGIAARIDATSLDLMSLPSVLIRKQEFFERISAELDEEIDLTRNATEAVMEESL